MRISSTIVPFLAVLSSYDSPAAAETATEQLPVVARPNLRGKEPTRGLVQRVKCYCNGWMWVPAQVCDDEGYVSFLGVADCGTRPEFDVPVATAAGEEVTTDSEDGSGNTVEVKPPATAAPPTDTDSTPPVTPPPPILMNPVETYDAIIVGAGWSGLKAAKTLIDDGHSVLVLVEARDYVGGRSRTDNSFIEGAPTELGSAWVYSDSEMDSLMGELGIKGGSSEVSEDLVAIYSPFTQSESKNIGTMIREDVKSNLLKDVWAPYTEYVQDKMKKQKDFSADLDYEQILIEFLKERQDPGTADLAFQKQFLLAMMEFNIDLEYAAENHEVSTILTGQWLQCEYGWKFMGVPDGGYGNGASEFAKPFIKENIQLEAKVTDIQYSPQGSSPAVVSYNKGGSDMTVSGKTVLVTVPLGVLKAKTGNNVINFSPPLSQAAPNKQGVIDNMKFGTLNKFIMYWQDPTFCMTLPNDKEWLILVTKEDETSGDWTSFYNPFALNGGTCTLIAWIGGDKAVEVEDQADEAIKDVVLKNLQEMFGDVPDPTKTKMTRWAQDEFSRGSYSVMREGRDFYEDAKVLMEPVGNLYYASEATALDGWSATTEGAYLSGGGQQR